MDPMFASLMVHLIARTEVGKTQEARAVDELDLIAY